MATIEIHADNTLYANTGSLTRQDDDSYLTDQDLSTVKFEILDQQGAVVETISCSYTGSEGKWDGTLGSTNSLSKNDRRDVKVTADGGSDLKGVWWRRQVRVTERQVP